MNKKIIVITYYWPPGGGSGVQRWLKFVKYLAQAGWEPIVITPDNPAVTLRDDSLNKDVPNVARVIRLPIWEPYRIFNRIMRMMGKKEPKSTDYISTRPTGLVHRVSLWVRGNFFIPDARIFWTKPTARFVSRLIQEEQVRHVVTTGPPHSMHLIGLRLKKLLPNIQWIADFRDPWTEWDLLDTLSLSSFARRRHKRLELRVLQAADRVITIAPYHVDRLQVISGRHVDLITNGFDEDDFSGISHSRTSKFTIRHIGVVDELRDPRPFMRSLKLLLEEQPAMRDLVAVEFVGSVNTAFKSFVGQDSLLSGMTRFEDQITHEAVLKKYGSTDLQLLVLAHSRIAPGNLPGKLFEYLASGNPILAVGPEHSDAATVLKESESGRIFEPDDLEGMKSAILSSWQQWQLGEMTQRPLSLKYSRKALTCEFLRLIENQEGG